MFAGHAGGLDRPVIGAHGGGFNRRTSSIAMMGLYTGAQPNTEMPGDDGYALLPGLRAAVAGTPLPVRG